MSGPPETFIIINHSAARARAAWCAVRPELERHGVPFAAHEARGPGDAQRRAREALQEGYRTVAVVGGDGTLGEVASGFFTADESREDGSGMPAPINRDAALAVLPGGTGNDFARACQQERATLALWIERLVAHARAADQAQTTRAIDVLHGQVYVRGSNGDQGAQRSFVCLNAATLGIGAEVAGRVAAQAGAVRGMPGEARFAIAALGALARWRSRRMRLLVDGEEVLTCGTNLVAVANSAYAGGGMMFSPEARVDDGLLDVVTACDLSRAVILREMARIHRGGHVANPRVRIWRGRRVRIETEPSSDPLPIEADGDVRGHTPVEFQVMPGALRVVV
ncbi:MAG: diacylglycerol/lipid kinase family protein [Pyrinomonadaceae bacterium]